MLHLAGPDAAHWPLRTPTQPQLLIDSQETVRLEEDNTKAVSVNTPFPLHTTFLLTFLYLYITKNIVLDSKCHAARLQSVL